MSVQKGGVVEGEEWDGKVVRSVTAFKGPGRCSSQRRGDWTNAKTNFIWLS